MHILKITLIYLLISEITEMVQSDPMVQSAPISPNIGYNIKRIQS